MSRESLLMTISLWPHQVPYSDLGKEDKPYLTPCFAEGSLSAVIVCPGEG
ncbi:MAG TPA: hypothetical protein VGI33_20240 [Paenibacillus sp.]